MFLLLAGVSVLAGLAGAAAAYLAYNQPTAQWRSFEGGFQPLWGAWEQAYGIDDIYDRTIVKPGERTAKGLAFGVDVAIIDGAVNGVGRIFRDLGDWARPIQTGYVRNYGALFLAGTIVIVIWLVTGGA